jgi:SAM-dependent methyltransferase
MKKFRDSIQSRNFVEGQYACADNLNARIAIHERFSTNPISWHHWVFEQVREDMGPRILDVGCGSAAFWRENAERIPGAWRVTLCDQSAGMVRAAGRAVPSKQRQFNLGAVDATDLPFSDQSFDSVMANHMLYHVSDVEKAIREFSRVLRPGGRLFAATNGRRHLKELQEWVSRFDPGSLLTNPALEAGFGLETGRPVLQRVFNDVTLVRHENYLAVTETAPLVDYIASMTSGEGLRPELRYQYNAFFEDCLSETEVIRLTKDTGLFVAPKGP